MKKTDNTILKINKLVFIIFLIMQSVVAQVGINTTNPDLSSILEVASTTKGMLTPRMTTAQKLAITSPANGLLVYDTDLKSYSYYDLPTTSWVNLLSGRSKFKRIKSTDVLSVVLAAELAAGSGTKYLMDSKTLYEINGEVVFNLPIEINNSYIIGLDSADDKIIKFGGDLFVGTTGGALRVLTLVNVGGRVFNITATTSENLIFRDLVIANSANVGNLNNFGFVFSSIVQFSGNANGIVYNNINKVLLSNQGWFGNNSGTYEAFTGAFELIGKQGGFSEVVGTSIGIDVSSNPTISVDASMDGVVFAGALTSGLYVKKYTVGSYVGFNFDKKWSVNCSGIPNEGDGVALADLNFDYAIGSGALTTLTTTGVSYKLNGNTVSNNLNRFSAPTNNRLTYLGNKKRFFKIQGSATFQASANGVIYMFFIAKNGTMINQSKIYVSSNSTNDVLAVPFQSIVELNPNDYIEVFAQRFSGSGNILTVAMNLMIH